MSKNSSIIVGVLVVVVLAVGGFALFHNSYKSSSAGSPPSSKNNAAPVNNAVVATKTTSSGAQFLADPNGKPLYTYNADSSGVSNCTGSCLSNWPGYYANASSANLPAGITTFTRSDNGRLQYAYNGMPLYYFTGDSSGNPTGNGVENFSLAKPASTSSTSPAPAPTPTPPSNNNAYPY